MERILGQSLQSLWTVSIAQVDGLEEKQAPRHLSGCQCRGAVLLQRSEHGGRVRGVPWIFAHRNPVNSPVSFSPAFVLDGPSLTGDWL